MNDNNKDDKLADSGSEDSDDESSQVSLVFPTQCSFKPLLNPVFNLD